MDVINLKKIQMTFEDKQIRVIAPLDPFQGPRYIEPIRAEEEVRNMESFYQMTANQSDYINPTAEGNISWQCDSSLDTNSHRYQCFSGSSAPVPLKIGSFISSPILFLHGGC